MNLLEETKHLISRYDHYYDTINNKGNLYLVINTFVLGAILAGYSDLFKTYDCKIILQAFIGGILLFNLSSIVFTILAIKPFLSKKGDKTSLQFFGDIAKMQQADFIEEFSKANQVEREKDSIAQVHELATGLLNKFKKINLATIFIGVQLLLILLFALILILKS